MPLIRKPPDKAAAGEDPVDLNTALASTSAEVRWAAARDVAGHPQSVPILAAALARESDARVREAMFTVLARIATPQSAAVVLPYLRADDAGLRTGALDALRAMPELTKPHLPQLLADPDSDVRLLACDLARVMIWPEAPRLLCSLVESEPQANVCAAAVEALAEIGDAEAVPSLARCAARFPDDPFLAFAIKAATDQLSRQAGRG
jgi:HEAT repeat protein